jgi:hypothetical protein
MFMYVQTTVSAELQSLSASPNSGRKSGRHQPPSSEESQQCLDKCRFWNTLGSRLAEPLPRLGSHRPGPRFLARA